MRRNHMIPVLVLGGVLGAGLMACAKEGPAERAGKQIDEAAKDLKKGAEEAADKVEDAAEELQEKLDEK